MNALLDTRARLYSLSLGYPDKHPEPYSDSKGGDGGTSNGSKEIRRGRQNGQVGAFPKG